MHWILIGIIIAVILVFQISVYLRTKHRLEDFKRVFDEDFEQDWAIVSTGGYNQIVLKSTQDISQKLKSLVAEKKKKEKELSSLETAARHVSDIFSSEETASELTSINLKITELNRKIEAAKKELNAQNKRHFTSNPVLKVVVESINVYLEKNKGNSIDYHLMKDIVDRNCDALEDEIQAQLPMPLYAGLAGTMSGVIVGVGYLWLNGGLKQLLKVGDETSSNYVSTGAEGIEAVLGGIALAMVASFVGIVLTTIGSWKTKAAKVEVEQGKQGFLSWLQKELLPKLKTGVDAEIGKITDNIKESNASFAENTTKLNATLKDINKAISGMTGMLHSLEGMNVVQFASANIQVYEKLKNCSDELGKFAEYITSLDSFIAKIDLLSTKMGNADDRVRAIEEMGQYFKDERSNLEAMKGVISSSIGEADANLKDSVVKFKESTAKSYTELATHNEQQRQALEKAIETQQQDIQAKLKEKVTQLDYISDELKKLAPIKDSVANFEKATREQNRKIDDLTASIRELAKAKAEGGSGGSGRIYFPSWAKWLMIISGSIVGITCLAYLTLKVLSLIGVM